MSDPLEQLDGAAIDTLIASLPVGARDAVVCSGEAGTKARHLARIGVCTIALGDDEGFGLVGPRAKEPTAYAELRALEATEQAALAASKAHREQTAGHGAAMRRQVQRRRDELAGPGRLERARRVVARVASLLRPRRREHRAVRRVRRSRRTQSASRGDPPGEPLPPPDVGGRR